MLKLHQQFYVDTTIHNSNVRKCISSPREYELMDILSYLELREGTDYIHQFCMHNDDIVIVVDFFFPKLGLVIELDGTSHKDKKQRLKDRFRDCLCRAQGYSILRIKTPIPKDKMAYWNTYFRELLRDK